MELEYSSRECRSEDITCWRAVEKQIYLIVRHTYTMQYGILYYYPLKSIDYGERDKLQHFK